MVRAPAVDSNWGLVCCCRCRGPSLPCVRIMATLETRCQDLSPGLVTLPPLGSVGIERMIVRLLLSMSLVGECMFAIPVCCGACQIPSPSRSRPCLNFEQYSLSLSPYHVRFFVPLRRCREEDGIIIGSKQGYATRFLASTRDLRPSGRASRGVRVRSV